MIEREEPGGPAQTIQPTAELFTTAAMALWATTYTLDLNLFNEFLLPRLGDPPLNVTVLADHRRLAASLDRVPAEHAESLAFVNRRWLLRGIRLGGAFHPKSYLAVTARRATLLVGSGNLSVDGLDTGREVFTTFRSETPIGDSAIAAWRSWMRRLVGQVGDAVVAERFQNLEKLLTPHIKLNQAAASPLMHNLDLPIADQLLDATGLAGNQADELWLCAPFYDEDAAASAALLSYLKPRRVRLFLTSSTSVNGKRLADVLNASGTEIAIVRYDPDRFIHAKLVGVVRGRSGWVLSGSANLSRAALTLTAGANGNIELAVLSRATVGEMHAAFLPPAFAFANGGLDSLMSLAFRADPEPELPRNHLQAAIALSDSRVEITTAQPIRGDWLLDDMSNQHHLTDINGNRAVSAGPVGGRLVRLVDSDGQILSNRVVVDDPSALAAALSSTSTQSDAGRPPELGVGDTESPLGQALVWLNRNLVMDVSERATSAAAGASDREAGGDGDDDLWDRLEREQLAHDPRRETYGRIWRGRDLGGAEPIIELLEQLGSRAPSSDGGLTTTSVLAPLIQPPLVERSGADPKVSRRWKPSTRIRVRARNVLQRWAAAQTDPRLVWVDPLAPAGNFAMIAWVLAFLRAERAQNQASVELTDDDLDDLWQSWLGSFAGSGEAEGWLDQLDAAARDLILERLPEWLGEIVAALCWLVVQPTRSGYRKRVVAFQTVLSSALNKNLIKPTEWTARYISQVAALPVLLAEVDQALLAAIDFIDDDLWCDRTADEFELAELKLEAPPGGADIQARLGVRGIGDPLLEPRLPRLIVALRRYRRCDAVALHSLDGGWRLAVATNEQIMYLQDLGGRAIESSAQLGEGVLEGLAAEGGVLANLFVAETGAVA